MNALDVGDLPPELTSTPSSYIAICGLDVENNPIHRTIWESFNSNRQERVPLFLKLLVPGHEFPKAKPKRASYDRYVPKGILKTNWLSKHLTEVPAVAVQFVDLDWDSPVWSEKRLECATKLEILRGSLQGRSTRVALVLIQKRAALPGADDQIAAERAASLCSACDLSGKTLFVLPHSDHLYGYTLRLQNAFYELAQTYYHHESRRIKNHKDHLNKTTHQLLFVRHQFKIAFLTELKQDIAMSLKNYKQAYANLMEVRASDTNMLEIKTVAGFINYKMCHLSFLNGAPLDAISQFRNHVDIFKNKVGHPELAFEHSAWMSKQFSHFGDLFEEAVQQGLAAIQTQHPGFYYQQAANHASNRKSLCYKLCKNMADQPDFSVLEGSESLEFYGQRAWRACSQSLEPPDPQKEMKGILALKYKELHDVDHSMLIIPLLSSAITQFKKYKCPRMKRQLTVEMGEEYYSYKDYKQALTLLKHVLWDYRLEKWRPLVSSILITALRSAYLSANEHDYISLGIEMISNWIICSIDEKNIVQNNISNLLSKKPLQPMPGIPEQDCKEAEKLWMEKLSNPVEPIFTIQMASVVPFIECKAGFGSETYMADQRITVTIYLRMNCPQPMSFSKLTVLFNNEHYNKFCEVPCTNENTALSDDKKLHKLYLVPRNTYTYTFNFIPHSNDIGKVIQITSVALQMGSPDYICAVLHWTTPHEIYPAEISYPITPKASSFSDDPTFQHIIPLFHASVLPRNAHITIDVDHTPPVLINEFYAFNLSITNDEISQIENVVINVGLKEGQEQFVHENTHISDKMEKPQQFMQYLSDLPLGEIAPGEKVQKCIYMKALDISVRRLVFDVTYNIKIEIDDQLLCCSCRKTQDLEVFTVEPFEFVVRILNRKFEEMQSIRSEEPFILKVDVHSYSPLPLHIEDSKVELPHHLSFADKNVKSMVKNLDLNNNEAGTDCFILVAALDTPTKVNFGMYSVKWQRKSPNGTSPTVVTEILLPSVDVTKPPIYLEMKMPASGLARKPLPVTYFVHNRTTAVQDMELLLESSDAFMFAGNKQMHFRILPRDVYQLNYILYPLLPGFVLLPHLRLTLSPGRGGSEMSLDSLVKDMTPSHIFIMPQGIVRSTEDASERQDSVFCK
ncbi:trafficking protein particle complex subunit 11 [Parasteatoda tepidariorum]|uniref:trafficking protein particle complex subunit 11 n=1 Tax=Parasteatoda tepidariorum TaxID=114398 RepID=UPI000A2BFD50|nr:trafficking protein particle complex subunit 11 [Parasteatoda tepidariorum]XP_042908521.1 trafficking protein particle complex subunit 11 [Parasteatoda tepidariorum]XP_042908522.1 trafficking protein particle complex subunit 11 [Parasteatoda tepidariorum]XP_042908523.1 trafficking protein particle complex subunit 11 [Parasteatoda tepidariorum]